MAEWSNAAVLKTVVPQGTGGSNPSFSATIETGGRLRSLVFLFGEMPEWSNGAVSKTVVLGNWDRGFESLSLRTERKKA
jgi:hypothetical protein